MKEDNGGEASGANDTRAKQHTSVMLSSIVILSSGMRLIGPRIDGVIGDIFIVTSIGLVVAGAVLLVKAATAS